jgi:hypothetical protein
MLLMSLSQFFIGGNWILEGDYRSKWKRFRSNKIAMLLTGLFLIYLPTVFWSSNVEESLKIMRINLPLLIFPFVMGSSEPLPATWYFGLIRAFIASVFLAALVCTFVGLPQWLNGSLTDIRHISLFISHIRFALLIVFAIFLSIWILLYKPFRMGTPERIAYFIVIVGLLLFMVVLQSLNGFAVLLLGGILWSLLEVKRKLNRTVSLALATLLSLTFLFLGGMLVNSWNSYFTPAAIYNTQLPELSKSGNRYNHTLDLIENGHYINAFVCPSELLTEWPKHSDIPLEGFDLKGHPIKQTLIRYLNSKGLSKDSGGIRQLNTADIQNIEKGIANVKYAGLWGLRMRFYQLMYEYSFYRAGGTNASGHTLLMKFEFWKAGLNIAMKNPWLGVGIGDVPDEFKSYYQNTNSWLSSEWRMTCHNQYLYFAIAGGIPMLFLFLYFLLTPVAMLWAKAIIPFRLFIGIVLLSMVTEDMLTTQAGVSLVAFFLSFFSFGRFVSPNKEKPSST